MKAINILMQESKALQELICNFKLKGFRFNQDTGLIDTIENLDAGDISVICEKLNVAKEDFYSYKSIIDNATRLIDEDVSYLPVSCIESGSLLVMELDNHQIVETLNIGLDRFIVVSDTIKCLEPMDEIQSVNPYLKCGETVFFRILRNGCQFPDDSSLFRSELIKMKVCSNKGELRPQNSTIPFAHTYAGCIYASKIDVNPLRFRCNNITDDINNGIFELNITEGFFTINTSAFRPNVAELEKAVRLGCTIRRTGNGLKNISPGCIYVEGNNFSFEMYIKERAVIEL